MTGPGKGNSHAPNAPSSSVPAGRWPSKHPLILGHRGSPREATENTLRSFDLALRAGADGVELDVRPCRDGSGVIVHDDSLDRAMGVRGRVSRLDWAAIERLTGARVPSLEQTVAWAAAAGAWLNIEVKAAGVEEEVADRVRAAGIADRVVVSSFDASSVARIGEIDPSLLRYFLTERWDGRAARRLAEAGAAGVCLRVDAASERALAELRERGLPVVVWTVNDPHRVRELLDAGVAGIISDDPGMAARARDAFLGG